MHTGTVIEGSQCGMLPIVILLVVAGWPRWPWWTPFGVFVLSAGLLVWKLNTVVDPSPSEAGLAPYPWLAICINFATTLALYLLAYWSGRGVARLMRRSGAV
jgi:hypothetical protein